MTPQILLDALRKAYLSLEVFCFIILDECHRATGNHPYARIMKVNFVCATYPYIISDNSTLLS